MTFFIVFLRPFRAGLSMFRQGKTKESCAG